MFKNTLKLFSFSLLLAFMFTSVVSAQTTSTTSTVDDTLEGIEVEEVTEMPTRWSMWWKDAVETITLGLTFDDVKKAEKQIMFAEERLAMAEYIMENTTDEDKRAWAENMISKSDKLVAKIEKTKEKWANHPDALKKNLITNVANLQLRKNKYLNRIENMVQEERQERFGELREESSERGQRIMQALENENVPEKVKEHLQSVKTQVEENHKMLLEYHKQHKEIIQAVRIGSTTAKDDLAELRKHRKGELKGNSRGDDDDEDEDEE